MPAPNASKLRRYQVYETDGGRLGAFMGYAEAWGLTGPGALTIVVGPCQRVSGNTGLSTIDGKTYKAVKV